MKVTNIEKFRTELFANLKAVLCSDCMELSEVYFERSEKNGNYWEICKLYNCLAVVARGKSFYVTVDEMCDVNILTIDGDNKFYTYLTTLDADNYNKTQFMMAVAMELQYHIATRK